MKKLLVFLVSLGFMVSCSSTKIVTDSAKDVNFNAYQTIKIEYQPNDGAQQINALNAKRVESAIQQETNSRGLSEAEEADLRIIWGVGVDIQKNYSTHSTYSSYGGYGYRGRYGGYGHMSGHSDTREYTTTTGTFQVAVLDAKTDEVLWLGSATDAIKGKSKKADEKINEVVEKVFEEFPIAKYQS